MIPTYDRRALLREAIDSVANQTFGDWELIVVADGSPSPIPEDELRNWARRDVRLLRLHPSQGGAGAKKAGAGIATGELLAFIDDDDLWEPTYLARADEVLRAHDDIRILFMGVKWFGQRAASGQEAQDRSVRIIDSLATPETRDQAILRYDKDLFCALLDRIPMPFQRPVTYRETYVETGGYRGDSLLWDCDWALRAALTGQCARLDEPLYLQRASGQGQYSQGRRVLEHTRANLEMKEYVLNLPSVRSTTLARQVRHALHRSWKDYSWQLAQLDLTSDATAALNRALSYGVSLEWLKMRLRIGLDSIRASRKQQ